VVIVSSSDTEEALVLSSLSLDHGVLSRPSGGGDGQEPSPNSSAGSNLSVD
jgi:hypothetical protein